MSLRRAVRTTSRAVLLLVSLSPAASAAPREWPVERAFQQLKASADSAWRVSVPAGIAYGDTLLAIARARGDRPMEAAAHLYRAKKYVDWYRSPDAQPDLEAGSRLSAALRDSAGLCRVVLIRGHSGTMQQKYDVADREFRRLVPMARAAGLPALEGFAHRALGFSAKLAGRYPDAARELRDAIRLLPPESFEHRHSRFLLAEVRNRTGHHDEARTSFLALLDEARHRNDRWMTAATLNDLGILEYDEGDMAMADRYWAFADGVFDSISNKPAALSARLNRAHALVGLGRLDDARALLERIVTESEKIDDPGNRSSALVELGDLHRQQGHAAESERLYRSARASLDDDVNEYAAATQGLAGLLAEHGRPREAEAVLDSLLGPSYAGRLIPDDRAGAYVERGRARRAQGRLADALADARTAERLARTGRASGSIYWLDAAIDLGRAQRETGSPDSAVATLAGAARHWERWRSEISDLAWREREGAGVARLFSEWGLALLDPRRAAGEARRTREAFEALQAFQARTLEERMHGVGLAGRGMAKRVSADSLRRKVLQADELLVDLVATPDTTFAFLVSRTGLAVRRLPGTRRLEGPFTAWREATLGGADAATVHAGLSRLSADLLGPLADDLRGRDRVVVSGGGPLALWPLSALTVPGETRPLGEGRDVFIVPSATLLAALRVQPGTRGGGLMLAVGRTTDARGRPLPGAERELDRLASRYDGVELRVNRGERSVNDLVHDLGRWDVLHFAAHAQADGGTPWRSGFLLGAGAGEDAYLRASRVAEMKLRARLAVLSGCQSAGSSTLAGEGALGLASAFLCSGTRSVVATLWPVDDRVAERFMSEFYASLARDRTVAAAVGDAQRALRANPETAGERDWAAFVVTGEGGTRIGLEPRESGRRGRP